MAIVLLLTTIAIYAAVMIGQRRVSDRIDASERERFNAELDRLEAFRDEHTVIFLTRDHAPTAPRPSEYAAV